MQITAETIMLYAIPVFFLLIGVELFGGLLFNRNYYRLNDAISNISCGISQQVSGAVFKLLGLGLYVVIYQNLKIFTIPNTWWTYIILFILIDFLYYWFHRYSHEINAFWGAHVVHHQSEDYNLSVALRQSAFQGFISSVFYLPLAIAGFDPLIFAIIGTFQTLYQFWIHTEAIRKLPFWFEYIFNTPSHHRVHHGRNPEYIDKNHGGTLIIFDRLFGTFEPEINPVVYGVTKPLASWNPIWANFDYYSDLTKNSLKIPGLLNKLRLWIDRPGWMPEALGGVEKIPEVSRITSKKYDTKISKEILFYVLLQFSLTLVATTAFLSAFSNLVLLHSVCLSFIILWTISNLGSILELKKWTLISEFARLFTVPVLFFTFFNISPIFYFCAAISFISICWFFIMRVNFSRN